MTSELSLPRAETEACGLEIPIYPRAVLRFQMTPGNLPAGIQSGAAKADRTVSRESNLYPVTLKETALFGAQCWWYDPYHLLHASYTRNKSIESCCLSLQNGINPITTSIEGGAERRYGGCMKRHLEKGHVCIKGGPLSAPVVLEDALVEAAEALVRSAGLEQGMEGLGRAAAGSTSWGAL